MENSTVLQWVLRIAIAGEFFGHGMFAFQGKEAWIRWIQQFTAADAATAAQLLLLVGIVDVLVAIVVLARPVPAVLAWAAFWGFWTALIRPLVGESFWDFIERWANWGAPLALLLILGIPQTVKDWFAPVKKKA